MSEGQGAIFNSFKGQLAQGLHNFGTGGNTFKVALFSSSYTPNIDTQSVYTALSNEVSGAGYTVGGIIVPNVNVTVDTGIDKALIDGDNVTWSNLGTLSPQPAWAVLYNFTSSSKYLVCYWEVDTPTNGGNWELQFSSSPSALFTIA